MRLSSLTLTLMGMGLAAAAERTASIYVQPITIPPQSTEPAKPTLLAEVRYSTPAESDSEIVTYEAPDLPADAKLVRIGVYDPAASRWASSTSVASVENFGKGYAPHFVVTVGANEEGRGGEVLGVSVRGVKIDAGHTRDFSPQVVVVPTAQGKQPELNRPVVLSPEGKKVQPEQEKTFLQKYVLDLGVRLQGGFANESQVLVGVGDRRFSSSERRRRGEIIDFIPFSSTPIIAWSIALCGLLCCLTCDWAFPACFACSRVGSNVHIHLGLALEWECQ